MFRRTYLGLTAALLIAGPAFAGGHSKDIVDTAVGAGSFGTLVAAVGWGWVHVLWRECWAWGGWRYLRQVVQTGATSAFAGAMGKTGGLWGRLLGC